jgi:hypothetical protein
MQVYGQHRNPGYFDRFDSREANLPSRIALLQQNVAKVSGLYSHNMWNS